MSEVCVFSGREEMVFIRARMSKMESGGGGENEEQISRKRARQCGDGSGKGMEKEKKNQQKTTLKKFRRETVKRVAKSERKSYTFRFMQKNS